MFRRSLTVFAGLAVVACVLLSASLPAAGGRKPAHRPPRPHGPVIHVSPSRGLTNAQTITVSGTGLPKTHDGSIHTWFVSLCVPKAAEVRNLDPDYSPYCSPTVVKSLAVSPGGTFSTPFVVATGKVGNGHCGTSRHTTTCLVAVGTGAGQHKTVTVTFEKPPAAPKPTTTTTAKP